MSTDNRRAREHPQLARLRAELYRDQQLCKRALAVFGEPAQQAEHARIRTDTASVELAISRALALAGNGILARLELSDARANN